VSNLVSYITGRTRADIRGLYAEEYTWALGPEREEVTADQRNLHNEELHDWYLPNSMRDLVYKARGIIYDGRIV